jgi:transposase
MITHTESQVQTMTKNRRYSPEFRLEAAQLVVDQGYTLKAACEAMGVGKSTMEYWVRRLRAERSGEPPQRGEALTPEQREIQELKRRLRRVEEEKEILKKATALLMSDSLSNSR